MIERITPAAALGVAIREFLLTRQDRPVMEALSTIRERQFTPARVKDQPDSQGKRTS